MGILVLLSIALFLVAIAWSVVSFVRSAEAEFGLLGSLFLLAAIYQSTLLQAQWGTPLAFDLSTMAGFSWVVAGILSVFIVIALRRTMGERDRVETIHWDSMEAVRIMNEMAANEQIAFDEKIEKLLEIGTARYGLEFGMVSRINKDRYEVVAVCAPEEFPISRGAVFLLEETFCHTALDSQRPVGIERITESNWGDGIDRTEFPYHAYLGASIRVRGIEYGTLSFASAKPRAERFTATDKDLMQLMAQWAGTEIERRNRARNRVRAAPALAAEPKGLRPVVRGVDANETLRRIEKELCSIAGTHLNFVLKLDSELGLAGAEPIPLDAIARTLVMNARDAMPEGGDLIIETKNLNLNTSKPGVTPAVAPDRYVTLSVSDTGAEPNAETLAKLFDLKPTDDIAAPVCDSEGRLPLPAIYRILQTSGGDLSVDVEPGHGSIFTVYLPRVDEDTAAQRTPAALPSLTPSKFSHS